MSEYIRKEDVENVIAKRSGFETAERAKKWAMMHPIDLDPWFGAVATAIIAVESLKPADVVSVVHAYWRDTGSGQECSACKEIQYGYDTGRHYCANCGAKMDGEE